MENNTRARVDVNLIGGVQFKHMNNCLMLMFCNDWVFSDWTLDVVFMVRDGTWVVRRVRCE